MKPKKKPLLKLLNRPTGTASRPPAFSRSATKPCSTKSASTDVPRRRAITSYQRERKLSSSVGCPISRFLYEKWGLLLPRLRNYQRNRLALSIAAGRCRNCNGVVPRRRSAHRRLRVLAAARRQQQKHHEHTAKKEHSQDAPTTTTASNS